MITRKTVLILGAGASKPYGFPVGRELVRDIVAALENPHTEQFGFLADFHKPSEIIEFANALDLSMQPSIDEFLENRPAFMKLGKRAIASVLIPLENPKTLHPGEHRKWYEYLFTQLGTRKEEFQENRLSVVTFNYDRSLEMSLAIALRNSYDLDPRETEDLLWSIPIVHVHGQLGSLFGSDVGRAYEPGLNHDTIQLAAEGIKVMGEAEADTESAFQPANKLIREAEVIAFVGFGYHRLNIDRLGAIKVSSGELFGSTYGMRAAEITMAAKYLERQVTFASSELDALSFLREEWVFVF